MADIQREIDEIRGFMEFGAITSEERMRQASTAYATACQEINRRLGQCVELIHRGLRAEAIHLAQTEPALLPLVSQLDFPGSDQWQATAESYGLPISQRLNLKYAETLNQSYAEELPLEAWMKKHRLLALAQASLRERLAVLRQIADLDTLNPVWDEDVRQFEKERYREIGDEFRAAVKDSNNAVFGRLERELTEPDWREPLPNELGRQVNERATRASRQALARRIQELEVRFNSAVANEDLPEALGCRRESAELAKQEGLALSHSLLSGLQPALAWVADRQESEAHRGRIGNAAEKLSRALREGRPIEQVRSAYSQLKSLTDEVPAHLGDLYERREESCRRARRTRHIVIAATVLVLVGMAITLTAFWRADRAHRAHIAEIKTKLDALCDSGSAREIEVFASDLTRNEPEIAKEIDVQQWIRKAEGSEAGKRERSRRFSEVRVRAEALPNGDPREAHAIEELKQYATSETDKAFMDHFVAERDSLRKSNERAAKEKFKQEFQQQLADMEKQLAAIPVVTYDRTRIAESGKKLVELTEQLNNLDVAAEELNNGPKGGVDKLQEAIEAATKTLSRSNAESRAIERVSDGLLQSPIDLTAFRVNLKTVAAVMGEERRQAFDSAAEQVDLSESIIAWEKLLTDARQNYLLANDARRAKERLELFTQWSKRFGKLMPKDGQPIPSELFREYEMALAAAGERDQAIDEIHKLFARPEIRSAYVLRSNDHKNYYVSEDPKEAVATAKRTAAAGDAALITLTVIGEKLARIIKYQDYLEHELSPQSKIAQKVLRDDIPAFHTNTLEQVMVRIVGRIRAEQKLDPLLAVILHLKVMEAVAGADLALAAELADSLHLIDEAKKSGVDLSVPWISPDRNDARKARAAAKTFLASMPDIAKLPEAVQKRRDSLEKRLNASRYQLVGWLYRDVATGWKVAVLPTTKLDGEVKTLHARKWVSIGKIIGGQVKLRNDDSGFAEGLLVFAQAQ